MSTTYAVEKQFTKLKRNKRTMKRTIHEIEKKAKHEYTYGT